MVVKNPTSYQSEQLSRRCQADEEKIVFFLQVVFDRGLLPYWQDKIPLRFYSYYEQLPVCPLLEIGLMSNLRSVKFSFLLWNASVKSVKFTVLFICHTSIY